MSTKMLRYLLSFGVMLLLVFALVVLPGIIPGIPVVAVSGWKSAESDNLVGPKISPPPIKTSVWIDPETCEQKSASDDDLSPTNGLVRATSGAIQKCHERKTRIERQQILAVERKKAAEERQAHQERVRGYEESGRYIYFGERTSVTIDGVIFTLKEIDRVDEGVLVHLNIVPENSRPANFPKRTFRFDLVNADGVITVCKGVRRTQGSPEIDKDGLSLFNSLEGESDIVVEFTRGNGSGRSFTIRINEQPVFNPRAYVTTFRSF